jgi:hypothetical protein
MNSGMACVSGAEVALNMPSPDEMGNREGNDGYFPLPLVLRPYLHSTKPTAREAGSRCSTERSSRLGYGASKACVAGAGVLEACKSSLR